MRATREVLQNRVPGGLCDAVGLGGRGVGLTPSTPVGFADRLLDRLAGAITNGLHRTTEHQAATGDENKLAAVGAPLT
jgi:hypothetical protein